MATNYAPEYSSDYLSKLLGQYRGSTAPTTYATEYTPEAISSQVSQLDKILQPYKQRDTATAMNKLAGMGVASGSPLTTSYGNVTSDYLNKLSQYGMDLQKTGMETATNERARQEQYVQSLLNSALGQTSQERLLGEQRTYEQPFKEADLLGTYLGKPTMASQQLSQQNTQFNAEQQRLKDAIETQKQWELAQAGGGVIGTLLQQLLNQGGGSGGGSYQLPSLPGAQSGGGYSLPNLNLDLSNLGDPSKWTNPVDMLQNTWNTLGQAGSGTMDWLGKLGEWVQGQNPSFNMPSASAAPGAAGQVPGASAAAGIGSALNTLLQGGNLANAGQQGISSAVQGGAYAVNPAFGLATQYWPQIGQGMTDILTGGLAEKNKKEKVAFNEFENKNNFSIASQLQKTLGVSGKSPSEVFNNLEENVKANPALSVQLRNMPEIQNIIKEFEKATTTYPTMKSQFKNFITRMGLANETGAYFDGTNWNNINKLNTGYTNKEAAQGKNQEYATDSNTGKHYVKSGAGYVSINDEEWKALGYA